MQPTVYHIKPEHVGQDDVHQFIRQAISKEYNGREYMVVNESVLDRLIPGRPGLRRIIAMSVETGGDTHALYFDITDVSAANAVNWTGR